MIISISTIEHIKFNEQVGLGEQVMFDDEEDNDKIILAIINLKIDCLKPSRKIIATIPLGYNKKMEKRRFNNKLGFDEIISLKRISKNNEWKENICVGIYENLKS